MTKKYWYAWRYRYPEGKPIKYGFEGRINQLMWAFNWNSGGTFGITPGAWICNRGPLHWVIWWRTEWDEWYDKYNQELNDSYDAYCKERNLCGFDD